MIDNDVLEYDPHYIQDITNKAVSSLQEASSSLGYNFQKFTKRKSKVITDKNGLSYILSIDHKVASQKSTIMELFANFGNGARFNPYDIITIPPHHYGGLSKIKDPWYQSESGSSSNKTNSSAFTTTIGLWIFNRSFIEPMSDILGYINEPVTHDMYSDINKKISYALLEDKITVRQLKNFIIQSQILMSCCSALAPSHTETFFSMEEDIAREKAKLEKQYKKELESGDLVTMKKMEKQLIDYAKDLLDGDEGRDMYDSGARSSYGNNFKNMYIMRSGVKQTNGDVKIVTSSYIEGMDPKDFVTINDGSVGGPYSRSRLTASGGYVERLVLNSTSHLSILPEGSDCGTNYYITIDLNKKNIKDWYFSFMIEGKNLIELTPENADKYIDKTVKFRYSSLCKEKNGCICEKCAGTLFRRIGITNAGMTTSIMASSMKNANMKRFHNSNINLSSIDVPSVFSLI